MTTTINAPSVAVVTSSSVFAIITPSDTITQREDIKAIYCTNAGSVVLEDWSETPNVVTLSMTAGQILPIRPRILRATGTTGGYLGLYS